MPGLRSTQENVQAHKLAQEDNPPFKNNQQNFKITPYNAILKGNKITSFIEKPKKPVSKLISAGLYVLEPEIINLVKDGPCSMEYDVFPKIQEKERLFGYPFEGQWLPTDNTERYEKAIREWKGVI